MQLTFSPEETERLGFELGMSINEPVVIALRGDLGVGKTVFARGIAKGLGVDERISSPSFVIMKNYKGRLPVYHIDLYRVFSPEDVPFIEDIMNSGGVVIIEWAERILDVLPEKRIDVRIEIAGENRRQVWINDNRD
ncbi:tRNA (adenosine(37)-N6)-threonylcarbamoyltransferase complex ATPase subunit type 1 TsaE [candidate division WOR-3 bacterium]|nr:tRNA (adenosine(37)-N6)-threonylcarbamoyltransferase complex ATPase subunit type 1 TsaE [candidate division WOR-3 bacterium]